MNLYDYIYVDLEKVISLYSQLTGGVIEIKERDTERKETDENKRNYDFKVFKHDAGGTFQETEKNKIIIKPHHAILQELELELIKSGHLYDLDNPDKNIRLKEKNLRESLKKSLCIKCTGRIVIEDYERMKKIGSDFPEIIKLINKSHENNLRNTPEFTEIENQIKELEKTSGDRNNIINQKKKAKELREVLENTIKKQNAVDLIPQWILDGMKTWIDAFLPNITNIRLYPPKADIDEHIFGHADSSNFTIRDSTALHFTYGTFPTEEFTMLGIITSVPTTEEEDFNALEEFQKEDLNDHESVERGFRGLFKGFYGLESMIRTCRYPRILVHPILVYRKTSPNLAP